MEINSSGFAARELFPNRGNVEQELTQEAQQKEETTQQTQKALEPRPVEQTSDDKLRRIDIYA